MEFEWNIFPGFNTLQLSEEVKSLLYRLGETPENFTGRIPFMSMFNDISCGTKDNEEECLANARLVSLLVLSVIKTEVPLDCDDPVSQDLLLQQDGERIEKLSLQDKLSKFCMDAGFLNVVEIGQYLRTKDTADLSQFHAVACREYTLPREEETSQPKGWIQGKHQNWARIGSYNQLLAR